MNTTTNPTPTNRLAVLWAAGTAAGAIAGAITCQLLLGESPSGASFVILLPLMMGAAVGLGQWLALRDERPLPAGWIAASAIGWLPAPLFYVQPAASGYDSRYGWYESTSMLPVLRWPEIGVPAAGAFAGIGVGIAQAILLPRICRSRGMWVGISAVAYFLGGILSLLLGPPLLAAFGDVRMSLSGSPVRDVLEAALGLARPIWFGGALGVIAGALTGWSVQNHPGAPVETAKAPAPPAPPSPAPAPPSEPPPAVASDEPAAETRVKDAA